MNVGHFQLQTRAAHTPGMREVPVPKMGFSRKISPRPAGHRMYGSGNVFYDFKGTRFHTSPAMIPIRNPVRSPATTRTGP